MPTSQLVTAGELVKTARLRKGMTQGELANKLGVNRNTVGRWESPKFTAQPDAAEFCRVIFYTEQPDLLEQLAMNTANGWLQDSYAPPGQMALDDLLTAAA